MPFDALANEFERMVDRFSGVDKNHWDLLAEIRDAAALAGNNLLSKVNSGLIKIPKSLPPWLDPIGNEKNLRFSIGSAFPHREAYFKKTSLESICDPANGSFVENMAVFEALNIYPLAPHSLLFAKRHHVI